MNNINELREYIKGLFDSIDDKATIEKLGAISSTVDKIEAEHNQLKEEQKDLLKDYKELIKHTSFTPNGTEHEEVKEQKDLTFDDFLSTYKKD